MFTAKAGKIKHAMRPPSERLRNLGAVTIRGTTRVFDFTSADINDVKLTLLRGESNYQLRRYKTWSSGQI